MTRKIKLLPIGKLSQKINIIDYSIEVIDDIKNHMSNLRNTFTQREINKILDLDVTITPPEWFCNLDIFSVYPFIKELPQSFDECKQVIPNFPVGITRINEIIRELIIILPDKPNIRAAFPFLATAYIIKDRKDMRESTSNLIYQLLDSGEKTGLDKFLKRFIIEPWHQKLSKAEIKTISYREKPMLRSYYVCILFSALICQVPPESNPYLSAALFEQQGGYARLFFPPEVYKYLALNESEITLNNSLNKSISSKFKIYLHQVMESDEYFELYNDQPNNLEPRLFFLRAKIEFAIKKSICVEDLWSTLTSLEKIVYDKYNGKYFVYNEDKRVFRWI